MNLFPNNWMPRAISFAALLFLVSAACSCNNESTPSDGKGTNGAQNHKMDADGQAELFSRAAARTEVQQVGRSPMPPTKRTTRDDEQEHFADEKGKARVSLPAELGGDASQYTRIPVFDLKSETPSLEIGLIERNYVETIYENILTSSGERMPPAERVLAMYLAFLHASEQRRAHKLYVDEKPDPQMATALNLVTERLEKANALSFVKAWYFGPFQATLIRATFPSGKSEVFMFSVRRMENRYYIVDAWENYNEVLGLFTYMARNYKLGLESAHSSRAFKHSFELDGSGSNGTSSINASLTVYVDGTQHPARLEWQSTAVNAHEPAVGFVHRALTTAVLGTNEEFVELWSERGRARLRTMLAKNPAQFQGLRKSHAAREIKDVFTLDLGEHVLHYYMRRTEPTVMRTIMLRRTKEGYEVADDLHLNVRRFIESKRFMRSIEDMWSDEEVRG